MTSGARLPFVVTLAALLVGAAAPARGQQPAADATPPARDEAPAVEIIQAAPPLTAPIPDPGAPPQQVRVLVHRSRPALVIPGAALFAATYAASLALGFFTAAATIDCEGECHTNAWAFVVPVGGPAIAWLMTPAGERGSAALWFGWSAAQAAGAAMLAVGILGHDVPEWRPLDGGPRLSVVPALTPGSGALALNVTW